MATRVIMPQLGESVVEGTVGRWLISEGQPIREYEPLLTVTTDKVDTEVPAPASGILLKIYVADGQTVASGTLLGEIGEPGEAVQAPAGPAQEAARTTVEARAPMSESPATPEAPIAATPLAQRMAAEHAIDLARVPGTGTGGRVTKDDVEAFLAATEGTPEPGPAARRDLGFISPAVASLSSELGVDLQQVIGTGEGGRITKKDVLAFVAAPVPRGAAGPAVGGGSAETELAPWERPGSGDLFKPTEETGMTRDAGEEAVAPAARPDVPAARAAPPSPAAEVELVPFSAIRRSIAKHMLASKQTSPHVTTVMEADMTRAVRARERLKDEFERQGVRLTFTPFFIQAIVAGLKAVPEANSSFAEDGLLLHRRVHVGMAVAIADGLIVPVIRDADEKSLLGLARAVNDLAERARTKRLTPEEVQGGTFTLTNHGTAGSLFATPIINQPQAGILGVGVVQKRAIVISTGHPLLPDAEDTIAIRPMAYLSFTFDHRILDGRSADSFLTAVKRYLETYSG